MRSHDPFRHSDYRNAACPRPSKAVQQSEVSTGRTPGKRARFTETYRLKRIVQFPSGDSKNTTQEPMGADLLGLGLKAAHAGGRQAEHGVDGRGFADAGDAHAQDGGREGQLGRGSGRGLLPLSLGQRRLKGVAPRAARRRADAFSQIQPIQARN